MESCGATLARKTTEQETVIQKSTSVVAMEENGRQRGDGAFFINVSRDYPRTTTTSQTRCTAAASMAVAKSARRDT